MAKIVVTHSVADLDTWLKGKSVRAESIGGMGGANVRDYVAHDGSNNIAITAETDDVAGMMATMAAPPAELAAAMAEHGVIQPMAIYVEK